VTGALDATRDEIELVCSYKKDDQSVANYFGISEQRVAYIRSTMKNSLDDRRITCRRHEGSKVSSGEIQMRLAEEDATNGSRMLAERIHRLFWKWEWKHGFQPGAAQILLPAGYIPEREAA
jgi:hypothetical protein